MKYMRIYRLGLILQLYQERLVLIRHPREILPRLYYISQHISMSAIVWRSGIQHQ